MEKEIQEDFSNEEKNLNKRIVKEFTPLQTQQDVRTRTDNKYGENLEDDEKLEKIKRPKRKFAIVHGYLGHKYCGNQK